MNSWGKKNSMVMAGIMDSVDQSIPAIIAYCATATSPQETCSHDKNVTIIF